MANSVRIAAYRVAMLRRRRRCWSGWPPRHGLGTARSSPARGAVRRSPPRSAASCPRRDRAGSSTGVAAEPIARAARPPGSGRSMLFALTFKLDDLAHGPDDEAVLARQRLHAASRSGAVLTTPAVWSRRSRGAVARRGCSTTAAGRLPRALGAGVGAGALEPGLLGRGCSPARRWRSSSGAAVFENFTGGMGTAAFLAFLMSVCEPGATPRRSSRCCTALIALSRIAAGALSGVLAERLGYAHYFLLTFAPGAPGVRAAALDPARERGVGRD